MQKHDLPPAVVGGMLLPLPEPLSHDWMALHRAIEFAAVTYQGCVDKAGEPILWHALRVGISLLPDIDAAVVGILHDVWEENPDLDRDRLADALNGDHGLDIDILELTRQPGEPYPDYIRRVARRPRARLVKIADLRDNLDPKRLARAVAAGANQEEMYRLQGRYITALTTLGWKSVDNSPSTNGREEKG